MEQEVETGMERWRGYRGVGKGSGSLLEQEVEEGNQRGKQVLMARRVLAARGCDGLEGWYIWQGKGAA
jgi:hypothetical protein